MMKKIAVLLLLIAVFAYGESRDDLVKYLPRNSFMVAGADFAQLQENEVYQSMDRNGQIWSYDGNGGVTEYLTALKIDSRRDVDAFAFSKYVNNYGGSGKVHLFDLKRDWSADLKHRSSTKYLGMELFRLSADRDMYAVLLTPELLATGNLNETKTAVDVAKGKVPALLQNVTINNLYKKIPEHSAVWGIALPLTRREAAKTNAKQNTNALLGEFQSYYFYGTPTRKTARTHFYGQTEDEKKASFISSFMIGTLLITKYRVDAPLAEALDQVDIQQSGNSVHVSMVVTKEMVDAYFQGKLGL